MLFLSLCSKSAVPELCLMKPCESLRFPYFLRSHYTATSHKPVEAFHSPNSLHTFCIGCFKYITATKSNLWDLLHQWIVQNFFCCWIQYRTGVMLLLTLFLYPWCFVFSIWFHHYLTWPIELSVRRVWEILF
jgi:hypothetical protein